MPEIKKTTNNYKLIIYIKRRSCIDVETVEKVHSKWGNYPHSV